MIENAGGTKYGDVLIGNDWGNVLRGFEGNDHIYADGLAYNGRTGYIGIDADDPNDPNRTRPEHKKLKS